MSLADLFTMIFGDNIAIGWLVIVFAMASLIEITPISINPLSSIKKRFSELGKRIINLITEPLTQRLDEYIKENKQAIEDIKNKIQEVNQKVDNHIKKSEETDVRQWREHILSVSSRLVNNELITKEELSFVIAECGNYIKYCEDNEIENGVAEESIKYIKKRYTELYLPDNDNE